MYCVDLLIFLNILYVNVKNIFYLCNCKYDQEQV
jgi:hypothetical protein